MQLRATPSRQPDLISPHMSRPAKSSHHLISATYPLAPQSGGSFGVTTFCRDATACHPGEVARVNIAPYVPPCKIISSSHLHYLLLAPQSGGRFGVTTFCRDATACHPGEVARVNIAPYVPPCKIISLCHLRHAFVFVTSSCRR